MPGTAVVLWVLLDLTEIGRFMYAIGGNQEAARLLLTCDWVDAEEAARIGLVWKIVPPEDLQSTALDLAQRSAVA